jgi:hypothetical protein
LPSCRRISKGSVGARVDTARLEGRVSAAGSAGRSPRIPSGPITLRGSQVNVVGAESMFLDFVATTEGWSWGLGAAARLDEICFHRVESLAFVGASAAGVEAADLIVEARFADASSTAVLAGL